MFSADRPIEGPNSDVLGYGSFAKALANSICNQSLGDGLVISINGEWGSGKTSVVNLTLKEIEKVERSKASNRRTVIVRFEPWLFSGQSNLVKEYFAALSDQLKKPMGAAVAEAAGAIVGTISKYGPSLMDGAALIATIGGQPLIAAAAKSTKAVASLQKADEERARLTKQRKKLVTLLKEQKRRILVVIDDVDRLYPEEMRLTLTMLKSVADLPNVTYLVPADIAAVRTYSDLSLPKTGASYLEKIIQVNLDMPKASTDGLDQLFSKGIEAILDGSLRYEPADLELVGYYIFNGLISTPRSIAQLINSLRVSWGALRDEAYFPDLLAIEALRLFEPHIYRYARNNKHKLLSSNSSSSESSKKIIDKLERKIICQKGRVKDLLRYLFPVFGIRSTYSRETDGYLGRRIQSDDGFDLYFRWSPNLDLATSMEINEFQELITNGQSVVGLMTALSERKSNAGAKASDDILKAMTEGQFKIPINRNDLVIDLLSIRTKITHEYQDVDIFATSSRKLAWALDHLFKSIPAADRLASLKYVLASRKINLDDGTYLLGSLSYDRDDSQFLSKAETANAISYWLAERFKGTAYLDCAEPASAASLIRDYLSPRTAKDLIEKHLDVKPFAARLAINMMSTIRSSSVRKPFQRLTRLPDEDFLDIHRLLRTLRSRGNSGVSTADQKVLRDFITQAEKMISMGTKHDIEYARLQ